MTEYPEDTLVDDIDEFLMGNFDGTMNENIQWIVVAKEENKALLLSKYVLAADSYGNERRNYDWEHSELREWMNTVLFNDFEDEFKKLILETDIKSKIVYKEKNKRSWPFKDEIELQNTKDRIFLLDEDDAKKYFGKSKYENIESKYATSNIILVNKRLSTKYTNYTKKRLNGILNIVEPDNPDAWYNKHCAYWLRSPITIAGHDRSGVSIDFFGDIFDGYYDKDNNLGVRPAMWVSLTDDE